MLISPPILLYFLCCPILCKSLNLNLQIKPINIKLYIQNICTMSENIKFICRSLRNIKKTIPTKFIFLNWIYLSKITEISHWIRVNCQLICCSSFLFNSFYRSTWRWSTFIRYFMGGEKWFDTIINPVHYILRWTFFEIIQVLLKEKFLISSLKALKCKNPSKINKCYFIKYFLVNLTIWWSMSTTFSMNLYTWYGDSNCLKQRLQKQHCEPSINVSLP